MTSTSYAEYRKFVEKLAFKKQKLQRILIDKKKAHEEYRIAHKIYRDLSDQQDALTADIINNLPDKY